MAYVKGERHDVFISYCRDDDGRDKRRWVSRLAQFLKDIIEREVRILENSRSEINVDIFQDTVLPQQGDLNERLNQVVDNSAIFVAVTSGVYFLSEWCEAEVNRFHTTRNEDWERRVFIVEKEPTHRESWPDGLKAESGDPLLGGEFFENDGIEGPVTLPMATDTGDLHSRSEQKLQKFGREIAKRLYEINQDPSFGKPAGLKKVCFAVCQPHQNAHVMTNEMIEAVASAPHDVMTVPDSFPTTPDAYQDFVENLMPDCDLFVQVLDENYGAFLSKDPGGFVIDQFNLASSYNKQIVQMIAPGVDRAHVNPASYRAFFEASEQRIADRFGEGFGMDAFLEALPELMNQIPDAPKTDGREYKVAVHYDIEDEDHARDFVELIKSKSVHRHIKITPTSLPSYRGGEAGHADRLRIGAGDRAYITEQSDGIIFIWGDEGYYLIDPLLNGDGATRHNGISDKYKMAVVYDPPKIPSLLNRVEEADFPVMRQLAGLEEAARNAAIAKFAEDLRAHCQRQDAGT